MNCFVGDVTQEECRKQDYKAVPKEVISLNDLPEDQQILPKLRVVCFNANPLQYYALRVPHKADRGH